MHAVHHPHHAGHVLGRADQQRGWGRQRRHQEGVGQDLTEHRVEEGHADDDCTLLEDG